MSRYGVKRQAVAGRVARRVDDVPSIVRDPAPGAAVQNAGGKALGYAEQDVPSAARETEAAGHACRILLIVAVGGLAALQRALHAHEFLVEDEVDDAGKSVRSVRAGSAAGDDIDATDERVRKFIHIHLAGSAGAVLGG